MSLNTHIKVAMPTNGIIVNRTGKSYVWKVLATYRNGKGQPTNQRRIIGKLDKNSGMLIPNNAYFEYYGDDRAASTSVVSANSNNSPKYEVVPMEQGAFIKSIGAHWFVCRILADLGVDVILKQVFGEARAIEIMLVASYMICRGNIMEYSANWFEEHVVEECKINSQSTSVLFSRIAFGERMAFFKRWAEARIQSEYIAYDVTSFSTYAKGIEYSARGYNRDKEKLPQINLAMYLGQTSRLPVYYTTYEGSIVDKSHLPHMMQFNEELGIKQVGFVLDRGFCNTKNFEYMREKEYTFIAGVEIRNKATRAAIEDIRSSVNDSIEYYITSSVRGKSIKERFFGVAGTLHIFYDMTTRSRQDDELMREVRIAERDLIQYIQHKEKLESSDVKKFNKYFDVKLNNEIPLSYAKNFDKLNLLSQYHGYFCMFSNSNLSTAEVLATYRNKDTIEKTFDECKNFLDMKRLHTHQTETTEGKIFCAFIGLIATMEIQNKCAKIMSDKNLTKEQIIGELNKIKFAQVTSTKRLYSPLTKLQKDILAPFCLTENDVVSYLSR